MRQYLQAQGRHLYWLWSQPRRNEGLERPEEQGTQGGQRSGGLVAEGQDPLQVAAERLKALGKAKKKKK